MATMTATMTSHEMHSFDNVSMEDFTRRNEAEESHATEHQLKPVDGGLDAWRVLLAAFMFEAILWGVYQDV